MNKDQFSFARYRIMNIAQNANYNVNHKKRVHCESVFKQKLNDYTVSDFLRDLVSHGENYQNVLEQMNVYDRQRAEKIIEECCFYAELLEQTNLLQEAENVHDKIWKRKKVSRSFHRRHYKPQQNV